MTVPSDSLPSIAACLSAIGMLDETVFPQCAMLNWNFSGGILSHCDEVALARGTAVTVRDLFFNVPARKKFLRSDQTELAHVASLVTHYSLAHPEKTFR